MNFPQLIPALQACRLGSFRQGASQRLGGIAPSFAERRLTIDVSLLPLCACSQPLSLFVHPAQPLTFALRGRALTFVRALLAFVRQPLAVVRYSLTLVGDPVSSARLEFASFEFGLAVDEGLFALIKLVSPALQLRGRLGAVLNGHSSP